jgi:hypothetical protein
MEQQQRVEPARRQRLPERVQSELPVDLVATEPLLLPALQQQATQVRAVAAVALFRMWRVQEVLVDLELSSFVTPFPTCRHPISIPPTTLAPTQTTSQLLLH